MRLSKYLVVLATTLVIGGNPGWADESELAVMDCKQQLRATALVEEHEGKVVRAKLSDPHATGVVGRLSAENSGRELLETGKDGEIIFKGVPPGRWQLCLDSQGAEIESIEILKGSNNTLWLGGVAGAGAAAGLALGLNSDGDGKDGVVATTAGSSNSADIVPVGSVNDGTESPPPGIDVSHPCLQADGLTDPPCFVTDEPPPISPFS